MWRIDSATLLSGWPARALREPRECGGAQETQVLGSGGVSMLEMHRIQSVCNTLYPARGMFVAMAAPRVKRAAVRMDRGRIGIEASGSVLVPTGGR